MFFYYHPTPYVVRLITLVPVTDVALLRPWGTCVTRRIDEYYCKSKNWVGKNLFGNATSGYVDIVLVVSNSGVDDSPV